MLDPKPSKKTHSAIIGLQPAASHTTKKKPASLYYASPEDPFYLGILVFDIRHSTAIIEDLTAADRPVLWSKLMKRLLEEMESLEADGGPFEIYKFLGDGWIIAFKDGPETFRFMLALLFHVNRCYLEAYAGLILPVLRDPVMPPPEISFGITWGQVNTCWMNGQNEYVGKPINEACRLQAKAAENDHEYSDSRGIISTGFYSKFEKELKGLAKPYLVSLRNVEGGRQIACYKLTISSVREWLMENPSPKGDPFAKSSTGL